MLWLVKELPPWDGWYREAKYFGPHLEDQYQQGVGIAYGELVFERDASGEDRKHLFMHDMRNPPFTQTRFWDEARQIMYVKDIVRVLKSPLAGPRAPLTDMQD